MKNIFITLIIFLFSCEELEEQTSPFSGEYYIFEGWELFMEQDYDGAEELFSAALLADKDSEINYYDYAYSGLGWTAIYKANINQGIQNRTLRENLRNESIVHFESADAGIELRLVAGNMSNFDSLLYANIIAGEIFNTSWLAFDKANEFYLNGSVDSTTWNKALEYSQLVITNSDTLLYKFPVYDFKYDEDINIISIRELRIYANIRLNEIDNAINEAELITDMDCGSNELSINKCLCSLRTSQEDCENYSNYCYWNSDNQVCY